jgi:hypothetical protein
VGDRVAAQGGAADAAKANGRDDAAAGATVVWFKQDLRMDDHPGLMAAAADGRAAVCVYVIDPSCMPCAPPQLLRTAVRVPVAVTPHSPPQVQRAGVACQKVIRTRG